ncbi:MAG: GNAT family N-acetyltransferase, partial [Corynebacterium variabile]|nr:GNAT family N-acetyltransferase [Corynebacterium variabile]
MREAEVTDIPGIRDLERRAGAPFREVGLDAVADDEPPTAETLRIAVRKGEVFVVEDTHRREDRGMGRS